MSKHLPEKSNQSNKPSPGESLPVFIRAKISQDGLSELLKAHDYAQHSKCDLWNFSVEISTLRQLGMSEADIRWLVINSLLTHRLESSGPNDSVRRFKNANPLKFQLSSCFMLTNIGAQFASESIGCVETRPFLSEQEVHLKFTGPHWDPQRRQLKVAEYVVKHFRWPAPNQELVLSVFQEENWPTSIDDPLVPADGIQCKERLRDTIKGLNRRQLSRLIQFRGNGTGEGITWQFTPKASLLGVVPIDTLHNQRFPI